MQELGPAQPPPTQQELIALLQKPCEDVMRTESTDLDVDRVWILRKNFNNWLYHRGLQNFAPQLIQSVLQYTSALGIDFPDEEWAGTNDFTQKHYTGFLRKFVAVIGNRMPNVIAVPNNPADEEGVRATKSANAAAIYLRESCDLEGQFLEQASRIFDFATTFWHIDWVVDGDKYGYDEQPDLQPTQTPMGDASFECPNCGASQPADPSQQQAPPACPQCGSPTTFKPPTMATVPQPAGPPKKIPKGALEITLHDSNTVIVPLDSKDINDCDELELEREEPKGRILRKYKGRLRDEQGNLINPPEAVPWESNATQMGTFFRSAMGSPLGLVRANRKDMWTCRDKWWTPNKYELVENAQARQALYDNFPDGARFIYVRGMLMEIRNEKEQDHWQECKPEPMNRIMCDALGDEWVETTDIANNTANQMEETIARSNLPLLVNGTRIDVQSWQNRRTRPAEIFPVVPRAGRSMGDEVFQPQTVQFSEQTVPFRTQVIDDSKNNTGLVDALFGGGEIDPTARQTLLKTNQALMQLGLFWTQIRKCLEKLMLKACRLLAEHADGVISFSKKNQFGRFDQVSFTVADLKSDSYHFEADEAIPVNWGQQRDELIWLLANAAENEKVAQLLGIFDPFNAFEFKQLLGVPGMSTPQYDAREKIMDVIGELLEGKPTPGQPNPDGSPGQPQASVQPDWEDDAQFGTALIKTYLLDNAELKQSNPEGYQNVQLYGQALESKANQPAPPPPPKTTVAVSFKGADLGSPAVQDVLQKQNLLDQGTQVQSDAEKQMAAMAAAGPQQLLNGAPVPGSAPIPTAPAPTAPTPMQ